MNFDADKLKQISMVVETSNVDEDQLDFTFNIKVGGVKYGFPCTLKENKVSIEIPALNSVIKDLKEGDYNASLEVTGDGKYYLKPFNENITITQSPKMNVLIDDDDNDVKESMNILINTLIDEDVKETVKETVKNKPDSILSNVFK